MPPKYYITFVNGNTEIITLNTIFNHFKTQTNKFNTMTPTKLYSKQYDSYCTWNGTAYENDGKVPGAYFYGLEKAKNNGFLPIEENIMTIKKFDYSKSKEDIFYKILYPIYAKEFRFGTNYKHCALTISANFILNA